MHIPREIIDVIVSFRETNREALTRKFTKVMNEIQEFEQRLLHNENPGYFPTNFNEKFCFQHDVYEFESKMLYVYSTVVNTYYRLKCGPSILAHGSVTPHGLRTLLMMWEHTHRDLDALVTLN